MHVSEFDFTLPPSLIAHHPLPKRTDSKLLCLDKFNGHIDHKQFDDLEYLLNPGDLLVFNDTKVIPARLYGHKLTGGKIELLIERIIDNHQAWTQIKSSKSPTIGQMLIIADTPVRIVSRQDHLFLCQFADILSIYDLLEKKGHIPLPPYITRPDTHIDKNRYQTVYAKQLGAVAAPTAGLHFDHHLLNRLKKKGINFAYTTLHVGLGTFQPIRVNQITEHKMHSEYCSINKETCDLILKTRQKNKRVIAVGTTAVRSLETASHSGVIKPFTGETDIFIYPGYSFKAVDGLITNFHLPKSTLIMLVCAFAGKDNTLFAYQQAILKKYRFYSYGDAMLINNLL